MADSPMGSDVRLASLEALTVPALRQRGYTSSLTIEARAEVTAPVRPGQRFVASYPSDGLRLYAGIAVPDTPMPPQGYPVVMVVHGWVGIDEAPAHAFFGAPEGFFGATVDGLLNAGFLVLTPALRGHGTLHGRAADGIGFLEAWDNGSYISPLFYAVDLLHLLQALPGLPERFAAFDAGVGTAPVRIDPERIDPVRIDLSRVHLSAHSQGGDAALVALAVSGEGAPLDVRFASASITAGCFAPRLDQLALYAPMGATLEAFMSGDGTWTGSAVGRDGSVNPDFVFPWPSDWIGTLDVNSDAWSWQPEVWSAPSVEAALRDKAGELYAALNHHVDGFEGVTFSMARDGQGRAVIEHDPRVPEVLSRLGAFQHHSWLTEPLHLHYSDQDYYSIPPWNEGLARRINKAGGQAAAFAYPANTHGLRVSAHRWFSPGEVQAGFTQALGRDIALFRGGPSAVAALEAVPLTDDAQLAAYARRLSNTFELTESRPGLPGLKRYDVAYSADGLRQYAMVLEPDGQAPAEGWPVVVMAHGYHPDPPNYGRIENGETDRPGDYYRGVPTAFAREGFLVVLPDYRGHNASEGLYFTQGPDAMRWYARDVIAAVRALPSLATADPRHVFLWGHSMGARVSLHVAGAMGGELAGVSLWSTAAAPDFSLQMADSGFAGQGSHGGSDPWPPVRLHHGDRDAVTPLGPALELRADLEGAGVAVDLHVYDTQDHLFSADDLERAVQRDVQWFRVLLGDGAAAYLPGYGLK